MLHTFLRRIRRFVTEVCEAKKKTLLSVIIRFSKEAILVIVILGVKAYQFLYENRKDIIIGIIAGIVANWIIPYL